MSDSMGLDPSAMIRYSAAVAGVQAGFGNLLTEDDWNRLLSASNPEQVISALGQTVYREAGAEKSGRIEAVERKIRAAFARRFRMAMPFLRGPARELFDGLWRPFELNNLIMVLRGIHHDVSRARIRSDLVDLGQFSSLDWNRLSDSRSVDQVIARLQQSRDGGFYATALKKAAEQYERRREVFILEVSLQLSHFHSLCGVIESLHGSDRRWARRFAGSMIETQNFLWACRYRIYFRFEPETILAYSLPYGRRVDASVLRKAATGAPLVQLVRNVWNDELPDLDRIDKDSEREALVELEVIFKRHRHNVAAGILSGYPVHLGVLLAWVVLLETEVDDLVTVIEGVDNDWPAQRIRSELIVPRGHA